MGGLFGIVGDASAAELDAMAQRLAHRGVLLRTWSPAPGVHLGQLGGEIDPDRTLVLDATLYEKVALREQLGLPRDAGSAQIFSRLLVTQGPQAASQLLGQFAVAWWDASRQRLVFLRDHFAVRPLYVTRNRGRWLFASEYKALLAIDDVPARPDRDAIRHLQCTRMPKSDATFLAGVKPVPRGAASEITREGLSIHRFARRAPRIAARSDEEHVEALRGSFLSALARQTEEVERFGLQLSGGFDSAFVFAGLRALRPHAELHTFTAGYGPDDPEVISARELAGALGSEHHELVLEPGQLPPLLPQTVWHMEDPYGREDQVYLQLLVGEAAKHVDALFAGYGADTSMAGMPRHRLAAFALRHPIARVPIASFYHYTQTGSLPSDPLGRLLVTLYTRGRAVPVPRVIGSYHEPHGEDLRVKGAEPLTGLLASLLEDECGWEAIETLHAARRLRFDSPFMDPAFLDIAFSIPDRLKIRNGVQKWALREAGRGLLPESVLTRRKTLQRLRHDARLADVLDSLAEQWLSPADVAARGLFVPQDVARVRRRRAGAAYSEAQAHRLWTLLVSELWCRLFLDARGAAPR